MFPLKKRRGSFESGANAEKDKKVMIRGATKMKTKMNKKCTASARKNDVVVVVDQPVEAEEDHHRSNKQAGLGHGHDYKDSAAGSGTSSAKKRGRGGGLMEGSRCSRVNGRGWRCCQQTLVGYSLCEHHLGKGRLRSMTSVRSRSLASSTSTTTSTTASNTANQCHNKSPLTSSSTGSSMLQEKDKDTKKPVVIHEVDGDKAHEEDQEQVVVVEEKKPVTVVTTTKKRMKLGMVKARSISSLLGQSDSAVSVSDQYAK